MTYDDYRQIRSALVLAEFQLEQWSATAADDEETAIALRDLTAARRRFEDLVLEAGFDAEA